MPIYEYQCEDCGLATEKVQKKPQEKIPCPGCSSYSFLDMEDVDFSFSSNVESGTPEPQSTGFTSYDTDPDRIIGDFSKKSWHTIREREAYKRSIMKSNNVKNSRFLSRNPDGTYRVMEDHEALQHAMAQAMMDEAVVQNKKREK